MKSEQEPEWPVLVYLLGFDTDLQHGLGQVT